jgi:hypothetical protein
MRVENNDDENVIAAVRHMFRLADKRGITRKLIFLETGISPNTIASWVRETAPAMMSLDTFVRLCRVIPDDLTSLVTDIAGKHIGSDCDASADVDIDRLEIQASGIVHEIAKARADKIYTPQEKAHIGDLSRQMLPTVRAVAA